MSKMFFKGRIETRENYVGSGYNVNRDVKIGSAEAPISVLVNSAARHSEIQTLLDEHGLFANIEINAEKPENTVALDALLNKPATTIVEKTPKRNEPCSCGSGKKYKKCCA